MEEINYEIDWKKAPEWAFAHAFDMDGYGYFFGIIKMFNSFCADSRFSGYVIGSEVVKFHKETWQKSITFRPRINK
jgi:hypothetical protein